MVYTSFSLTHTANRIIIRLNPFLKHYPKTPHQHPSDIRQNTDLRNQSSSQVQLNGFCARSIQVTLRLNSQGKVSSFTTVMPLARTISCGRSVTLTRARPRLVPFTLLLLYCSFWQQLKDARNERPK